MSKITIADITDRPPIIWDKDGVIEIFELYKEMYIPYKELQGMPDYPINLDPPQNQTLIREIIGFLTEEVFEAVTSLETLNEYLYSVSTYQDELDKLVSDYNEEVADILHFLVKLLIYSNIDAQAINSYYLALAKERGLTNLNWEGHTLSSALGIAVFMNSMAGRLLDRTGKEIGQPANLINPFLRTPNRLSYDIVTEHKAMLFEFTHNLNRACNTLKNKPWKVSSTPTDAAAYQLHLMEAWLWMMNYLQFIGHDDQSVFSIFWYKNMVNRKRIQNNY